MKQASRTRKLLAFVLLVAMTLSSVQFAFANTGETPENTANSDSQVSERAAQPRAAADKPSTVDETKNKLDEPHFAVVAMNKEDGLIFEPHNVWVLDNEPIWVALKNSGHKFENLETEIKKIDGKVGNYVRYYNGEKYDLSGLGKDAGALVFTERLDADVKTKEYQTLVALLADHKSKSEEERQFDDVKAAYEKALRELPTADKEKAVALTNELKDAYKKYKAWNSEEKAKVSFNVTMDGRAVSGASVSAVNKYGKEFKGTNGAALALNSGEYKFVVTHGQNEVSGTFTVAAGEKKVIDTPLMIDNMIADMKFMSGNPAKTELHTVKNGYDVTTKPYDADSDLYVNIKANDGAPKGYSWKYKLYAVYKGVYDGRDYGDESESKNVIPWASNNRKLKNVINYGMSADSFKIKVVHQLENGYIQRQYYPVDTQRLPTLSKLEVTDKNGNSIPLNFDPETMSYGFDTTDDKLTLDLATQRKNANASFGSAAEGYLIRINDNFVEAGKHEVNTSQGSLTISVMNTNTYTENSYRVDINKVPSYRVTIKKAKGVDVKLVNQMGGSIKADQVKDTEAIFNVGAGNYEWVSTLDKDYHAKASIKVEAGKSNTFEAKTPVKEALINSLSTARNYNVNPPNTFKEASGKSFDWKDHSYKYVVPDYSSIFDVKIEKASNDIVITRGDYTTYDGTKAKAENWFTGVSSQKINKFINVGGLNNSVNLTASKKSGGVTYYQDYKISTVRSTTLHSLDITDNFGKTVELYANGKTGYFDTVNKYQAEVPSDVNSIDLSLTFPGEDESEEAVGRYVAKIRGNDYVRTQDGKAIKVKLELDASKSEEDVEIEVVNTETGNISNKYTIKVSKAQPVAVRFNTNPKDSRISLKNEKSGKAVSPEADGSFLLVNGTSYTYTVTHADYIAQSKTFKQANQTSINVSLVKAPVNSKLNKDLKAEWPNFRYDTNNNGVLNYPLPRNASETALYWATKFGSADMYGSLGCPIMVDGYIYNYAGTTILKFDSMTGEIVKTAKMKKKSSFAINAPTYAEGMIFVGLEDGTIQAFDAETLESLWIYEAPRGGQPNCPIAYKDGYIYTGFWVGEESRAEFVCLSVTDEDPTRPDEVKSASWVHEGSGYYWAGAYVGNGNAGAIEVASKQARTYIVVGSDDGKSTGTAYGELLSLDPINGRVIDSIKDTFVGDIRSTIMFDKETARYYFVTKGGYFCSVKLNEDGSFDRDSIKTLSLLPKNYQKYLSGSSKSYIPMSASTPVIYKGRAYIGVGGSGNFAPYSGHNISVIDLKSNTIAYSIETRGYPQASSLLTTAYEKDDHSVYVYFFENLTPGKMRVIKDKPGQTAPSEVQIETDNRQNQYTVAPTLFTPSGAHAQYVICSPIADEYGNIYFKNDSSHMFMIGPTIKEIRITQKPKKTEYTVGETFDPTGLKVEAVYSTGKTRDITKYIGYNTNPLSLDDEDFEIRLKTGSRMYQDKNGKTDVTYIPPTAFLDLTIKLKHKEEPAKEPLRIAGVDRYETSLKVAEQLRKVMNVDKFDAVVVAYGDNYADALSGAYLAKVNNAPLLLINEHNMQGALDYINKYLKPGKSSKVYLLGGKAVMPEAMKTKLENKFTVKRISGEDRFATNMAILKEAGVNNEEILICSGYGFADSLSASASGRPILIVDNSLSSEQLTYLKSINSRKYTIIGGYISVSRTVEGTLKGMGTTARVFGEDRYRTSTEIAKFFFKKPNSVVIGYGDNFPDGLCGGVLAEKLGAPLLLINGNNTESASEYVKSNSIKEQIVLGGKTFIPDSALNAIIR